MPLYEYKCKKCVKTVTITRNITDNNNDTIVCELCDTPLQRKYGWGATTFNGKGFYTSDKRIENKNYRLKE